MNGNFRLYKKDKKVKLDKKDKDLKKIDGDDEYTNIDTLEINGQIQINLGDDIDEYVLLADNFYTIPKKQGNKLYVEIREKNIIKIVKKK